MAAHRYWRIWTTTMPANDNVVGFAEIELRESSGGVDRTGSGTASTNALNPTYPPSAAVDNNNSTFWSTYQSGVTSPPWIWSYDFGAGNAFDITWIYIVPRQDGWHTEAPGSWKWEWSDDGTNWTPQCIASGITWPNNSGRVFDMTLQDRGVYVTQEVLEVVTAPTTVQALVTQEVIEVVMQPTTTPVLVSQECIEIVINTSQAENPSSAVALYSKAGMVVREAGRSGALGGLLPYSPRIAFSWQGIANTQLGMDGAGVIRTMSQDGLNYVPFAAALIESKTDGVKFPDGTVQTTAAIAALTYSGNGATGRADTTLPRQPTIRFSGAGVIVSDNPAQQRTEVYIPGGSVPPEPPVTSVFGRTGFVTAQAGDYPPALLGTGTPDNTVFLRGDGTWSAGVSGPAGATGPQGPKGDTGAQGPQGPAGNPATNLITSVFGRQGVVAAQAGDYTVAQITGAVPNTVQVIAGTGLTGGGALTGNVTISVGTVPIANLAAGDYSSKVTSGTYSISITGTAQNANTLGGLALQADQTYPAASQVLRTGSNGITYLSDMYTNGGVHAAGYIWAPYFNFSGAVENNPVVNVLYDWGQPDGYIRRCSLAHFNNSISPLWGNIQSKPAICYNDGGTYSINITGSSLRVGNAAASSGNANTDFNQTIEGTRRHLEAVNITGTPANEWWFLDNIRHTNAGNYWGRQFAYGWNNNDAIFTRRITSGAFDPWRRYILTDGENTDGSGGRCLISRWRPGSTNADVTLEVYNSHGQPNCTWGIVRITAATNDSTGVNTFFLVCANTSGERFKIMANGYIYSIGMPTAAGAAGSGQLYRDASGFVKITL